MNSLNEALTQSVIEQPCLHNINGVVNDAGVIINILNGIDESIEPLVFKVQVSVLESHIVASEYISNAARQLNATSSMPNILRIIKASLREAVEICALCVNTFKGNSVVICWVKGDVGKQIHSTRGRDRYGCRCYIRKRHCCSPFLF